MNDLPFYHKITENTLNLTEFDKLGLYQLIELCYTVT